MMVSPTATTRHGSLPPRAGALFFTSDASFNKSFGSLQSFICVVYENIDRPSPDETGCLLFLRKDQGEVSEKRAMVGGSKAARPGRLRSIAPTLRSRRARETRSLRRQRSSLRSKIGAFS